MTPFVTRLIKRARHRSAIHTNPAPLTCVSCHSTLKHSPRKKKHRKNTEKHTTKTGASPSCPETQLQEAEQPNPTSTTAAQKPALLRCQAAASASQCLALCFHPSINSVAGSSAHAPPRPATPRCVPLRPALSNNNKQAQHILYTHSFVLHRPYPRSIDRSILDP